MFSCQHGFLHELTLRLNRMTWSINGVVKVDRVTMVDGRIVKIVGERRIFNRICCPFVGVLIILCLEWYKYICEGCILL